ncbi:endonuclease/exonuclease/phosphatase family protein [Thalassorhabdomicrobium marinisediminis]|uniref:endonuclease/exonuclease/phosphatase family protein n=1 Tax=Thalassorhabdomicrobium marinisediminis TaxID=2170577 RepID=UPI0011B23428|nr:endonuclease/exonuclease/phosphatase family protein [Thalassorhabdomicrobium marinisediminis]
MRIVSLNASGGQVWPALGGWAGLVRADVLSLQGVTQPKVPSPPWLNYRDAFRSLNQRSNLVADISGRLPGYTAQFHAACEGPMSDNGGRSYPSAYGLAQWIAPGLTVETRLDGFVHGAFRADGWGDAPLPCGFQASRLRLAGRARPITVAHFHGLQDGEGADDMADTPARAQQARQALSLLDQIATSGDDVVLSGDFNVRPNSETLRVLQDWGLRDLVGDKATRTSLYGKPQRHGSYMLVSRSIEVKRFDCPADPVVSDHRPLILEV